MKAPTCPDFLVLFIYPSLELKSMLDILLYTELCAFEFVPRVFANATSLAWNAWNPISKCLNPTHLSRHYSNATFSLNLI